MRPKYGKIIARVRARAERAAILARYNVQLVEYGAHMTYAPRTGWRRTAAHAVLRLRRFFQ